MADPVRIARAIKQVSSEVDRWMMVAQEALGGSASAAQSTLEVARRSEHTAAIERHRSEELANFVRQSRGQVEALEIALASASDQTRDRRQSVEATSQEVDAHTTAWNQELQDAFAWRKDAEGRVKRAEQSLEHANSALNGAERDLSRANSALSSCRRDKNRRSCGAESSNVSSAEHNVKQRQNAVDAAKRDLAAAREDLLQAVARCECCQSAVEVLAQASGVVARARTEVGRAEAELGRSKGEMDSLKVAFERAEAAAKEHDQTTSKMREAAGRALRAADASATAQRSADSGYQSAGSLAHGAKREMDGRIDRLREFDQAGGL